MLEKPNDGNLLFPLKKKKTPPKLILESMMSSKLVFRDDTWSFFEPGDS